MNKLYMYRLLDHLNVNLLASIIFNALYVVKNKSKTKKYIKVSTIWYNK